MSSVIRPLRDDPDKYINPPGPGGIDPATLTLIATAVSAIAGVTQVALALLAPGPDITPLDGTTKQKIPDLFPQTFIFGEARLRGLLVWSRDVAPDNEVDPQGVGSEGEFRDLHINVLLGNATPDYPMDSLQKVWIDSEEIPLRRVTGTGAEGPSRSQAGADRDWDLVGKGIALGRIWVREHLDGTHKPILPIDISHNRNSGTPIQWADDCQLLGRAWLEIVLRTHVNSRKKPATADEKLFDRYPNRLDFLVRGNRMKWPGQAMPVWTQNAAIHAYWFMRHSELGGLVEDEIHQADFQTSRMKSDEDIQYTEVQLPQAWVDAGYTRATKRYKSNGIYQTDQDPIQALRGFESAMAGHIFEGTDGLMHIRAGYRPTPVATLTAPEDLIDEFGTFSPGVEFSQRGTEFTMTLKQDVQNKNLPSPVTPIIDTPALKRDGIESVYDLGLQQFISDKIQAARVGVIRVKEINRATARFAYRAAPGEAFERLAWNPTDHLLLVDPTKRFSKPKEVVILRAAFDPQSDSLLLDIAEYDPTTHNDSLILPPIGLRDLDPLPRDDIFAPTGVVVDAKGIRQRDGAILLFAEFIWNTPDIVVLVSVEIRLRKQGEESWSIKSAELEGPFLFPLADAGIIEGDIVEYQIRFISNVNQSEWTPIQVFIVDGDLDPPPDPTGLAIIGIIGGFRISWTDIFEERHDYAYTAIQIRTSQTEAWRSHAIEVGPPYTEQGFSEPTFIFVRLRHVDRSGNYSAWRELSVRTLDAITGIQGIEGRGIRQIVRDDVQGILTVIFTDPAPWECLVEDTGNVLEYLDENPLANVALYRIRAKTAIAEGEPSNEALAVRYDQT